MAVHEPRFDSTVALLVVDVQNAIDDAKWGPRNNLHAEDRIVSLLAAWRRLGWPIVHIRHDSTNPVSPYRPGQVGNDFKPAVAPLPSEIVVTKHTNSAFIGTDLHQRLADLRIATLVVCGVLTHNSLEATVRNAGNLGFRVFVPADCCWSVDKRDLRGKLWAAEDVHQLSLANMHGEYARVTTAQDILVVLDG
jgi:nicotinamidase-related amidase